MIMSGNEAWNRNVFKRWRKVDRDGADITLSGRLFEMVGPAIGKARPPTVDILFIRIWAIVDIRLHPAPVLPLVG